MAPRSSSITKRWLFNSFGIIVVIMVAMVIGVSAAMHSFYYNSVSQYINNRAEALSARLDAYAADAGSDFSARLYTLVQDFEYKDRIELMAINTGGEVFLTSSGFLPQDDSMPDLQEAKATGSSTGSYVAAVNTGDNTKVFPAVLLQILAFAAIAGVVLRRRKENS